MTMRLPFSAASVPEARRRLKTWMVEGGLSDDTVEDARLVLTELVANSVRHARPLSDGNIVVSWLRENGDVELRVTDGGGSTVPRQVRASSSALAGRGMTIVDALASRWWTERSSTRSTVHVLLSA
jgi:anti-sigma regulatory factor (Ser/Thr protein kinase)